MNKHKKKFIDKLKRQSKVELVDIIVDLWEARFHYKKEIEKLNSLVFSHQQVIGSILDSRNIKFIYEVMETDEDDSENESMLDKTKKESIRSYT